jgi:DNA-binding transcriptional ArsR family regulator
MLMAQLIAPHRPVSVTFALEPVYNAITSLSLLDMAEGFTGLGEWVYRTAEAMSPEERYMNRHVIGDALVHLLGEASWPSFEAWIDDLASRDAATLRMDVVRALFAQAWEKTGREVSDPAEILADRTTYLTLVDEIYNGEREPAERALWEDMYGMFLDPVLVQERIVTYLRRMWEGGLAAEWERHLPALEESVAAFQSLDMSGLTAIEALMRVSLREVPPPGQAGWNAVERIIFIPSVHIGPYLLHFGGHAQPLARVVYGARIPEGAAVRSPTLSRSELLMRLNALANDTRLRILELLAPAKELSTVEIMEQLDLSQSAASRHLEHLAATGYLIMRGDKRANLYRLNPDQIDRTFSALKAFCQ